MKMIRVLFYTGDDFISRIIKKFTKSEFTHVSIQLDAFHIAEARFGKPLSIVHFKDYKCVVDYIDIEIEEWKYDIVIKKTMEELDSKYDMVDILSLIFPFIKGNKDKRICTEFVVIILNTIGYDFKDRVYTPIEIYNILRGRCN